VIFTEFEPGMIYKRPHSAISRTCFAFAAHAPIRKARSVPVET
jgi:hypothetical protein